MYFQKILIQILFIYIIEIMFLLRYKSFNIDVLLCSLVQFNIY